MSVPTSRDRLLNSTAPDSDLTTVLIATLTALHEAATFSWAAVMAVDPQTILPTAGVVEGFAPVACGPFWDFELSDGAGYNKFSTLARSDDPVATLYDATDGDLQRSPAFAQLFCALGAGDELRAVFTSRDRCWGIASLLRRADDGPFPEPEVDAVRALCPVVGLVVHQASVHVNGGRASQTAMLVVDSNNDIVHVTADARPLLDDLRATQHIGACEGQTLGVLTALVTRARSNRDVMHVSTRLRTTTGAWYRVTAAPTESGDGHVAVVIEPARGGDLLPMVLESYGLTAREIDIVGYLARGLASSEIAAELHLSTHTVRDHVKALLHKCDARTRGELVARLFAEHLRPELEASVHRTA
ncbi:MAG: helix-turn-helix transcriptional regulator [Actinomycetota bacterium]|nr:helix-turn-helix transcriptional regulator [Actinomycetota bacterium]